MVTIDPNKSISTMSALKKTESGEKTGKDEFDAILRQAVGTAPTKPAGIETTPFVSEIRPAQFETQTMSSSNMIIDHVHGLIETMEAYQQKLIENGATLKEIEPLLDKMNDQSQSLSAVLKGMENEDQLRSIADQSLMLSSMETVRFKSGLYNDG